MTFTDYAAEIGVRMDPAMPERTITDRPLGAFGEDFDRAHPDQLRRGLFMRNFMVTGRPEKGIIRIYEPTEQPFEQLDREQFPGVVANRTGVAVSEDLYETIVQNAPYYANKIYNRTQRKLLEEAQEATEAKAPIDQEAINDLAGESVFYALHDKMELLEDWDADLLRNHLVLARIISHINRGGQSRISQLEPYREAAEEIILETVRIACKARGFGTNETVGAQAATASRLHRSGDDISKWWVSLSTVALRHNEAMRGKINESMQGIVGELGHHAVHLFNNIDREYEDKKPTKKLPSILVRQ
jgi:hypothetical protein